MTEKLSYNLEQAQEEAEKKEKIQEGEVADYFEAEKLLEGRKEIILTPKEAIDFFTEKELEKEIKHLAQEISNRIDYYKPVTEKDHKEAEHDLQEYVDFLIKKERELANMSILKMEETKKIIEENPELESKIEKIKEKIIDIQQYKGLIHFTHPGNMEGLFKKGFTQLLPSQLTDTKGMYGYGGRLHKAGNRIDGWGGVYKISFTTITNEKIGSFRNWLNVPWGGGGIKQGEQMGPLCFLIDHSNMSEVYNYSMQRPDDQLLEYLNKQLKQKGEVVINYEKLKRSTYGDIKDAQVLVQDKSGKERTLSLKELIGLIKECPNSHLHELEVGDSKHPPLIPVNVITGIVNAPTESVILKRKKSSDITFDATQNAAVTINRLNRILKNSTSEDLVPMYDNFGNVLWPEYINYKNLKTIKDNE